MFSQIRQAVETFAPQPRHGSQYASVDESSQQTLRSQDSQSLKYSTPLSSTQLADSAISNLRRSLVNQRPSSPRSNSPRPRSPVPSSLPRGASLPDQDLRQPKSNLEERLRAKFAIGEASNATTPDVSGRASPTPFIPVQHHPLSPTSIPLPQSPPMSPMPDKSTITSTDSSTTIAPSQLHVIPPIDFKHIPDSVVIEQRYSEADVPLPPDTGEFVDVDCAQVSTPPNTNPTETDVDILQQRLRLVEQRFADVSMSFKRLQAEKLAADSVIRELTPAEGITDIVHLRDHLQNMVLKLEISQDETQRLSGKLTRQEERLQELRDTHRLESKSQSDLIDQLRRQIKEIEAILSATQKSISERDSDAARRLGDIDRLQAEVERSNRLAKEEEEKRVKAISLLKTVRQKLVKAEKEKEDVAKELTALTEKERGEREKEKADKLKFQQEINTINAERERAVVGLKAQFDKEVSNLRENSEKEVSTLRGQLELELLTLKSSHSKELTAKQTQISALENSANTLSNDKNAFFYQLQLRQAELESSQSHLESLQSQNTELQYQLRESKDRLSLMNEELAEALRDQETKIRGNMTSPQDVARLLSATEAKYESKIADLKANLNAMERERNESEVEWSRKLREKTREMENLKIIADTTSKTREQNEEVVMESREEIKLLREEIQSRLKEIAAWQLHSEQVKDAENVAKEQLLKLDEKTASIEQQVEESKSREAQLRVQNKTLREELRKVQSSAALLERQRNPGVGYWMARPENNSSNNRSSISSSPSESPSRTSSPGVGSSAISNNDEDVNLEYLRNVILQFLEHKEMRPNLVRVLSIILRFTPQETRRIIAKV